MTLRDQIAEQALTLPPEDRAFLAELLEESLSSNGFATPSSPRNGWRKAPESFATWEPYDGPEEFRRCVP